MENPCDTCIVFVMCANICELKDIYTKYINEKCEDTDTVQDKGLFRFYQRNIQHAKYVDLALHNQTQIKKILYRRLNQLTRGR